MARAGAVPFWGLLGAVLAIPLLGGSAGAQQPPAQVGGELPVTAVRQIEELLAEKAQRTPAQRKVSSQLLDAAESAQRLETEGTAQGPETEGIAQRLETTGITQRLETEGIAQQPSGVAVAARQQVADPDAERERVTVDIRADVTPVVLARIRSLGGTVINSVPKFRAIRAQLPLSSVARLAALAAVQSIRPADEAVTRKDNTSAG